MIIEDSWRTRQLVEGREIEICCHNDNGLRFVTVFRKVWDRIPSADCEPMVEHWTKSDRYLFELSNFGFEKDGHWAFVTENGTILRFRQEYFACAPESALAWVIAHELAHVYQKVLGMKPGGMRQNENSLDAEEENEAHANRLAREWGFRSDELWTIAIDMLRESESKTLIGVCADFDGIESLADRLGDYYSEPPII